MQYRKCLNLGAMQQPHPLRYWPRGGASGALKPAAGSGPRPPAPGAEAAEGVAAEVTATHGCRHILCN
jgi:hypothetical protein